MTILDRYIMRTVLNAMMLVLLILMGVESFMEFIGQLHDLGTEQFGVKKVMLFVLLRLPSDLYQLFPMAGFLGCLIGLGRLATTSELIVMRAAGVSVANILLSVCKAALCVIVIITVMGEMIAPKLQNYGVQMKAKALGQQIGYGELADTWMRDDESFIHIGNVPDNQHILYINRFLFNKKHQLLTAQYAPQGEYKNGYWNLFDAHITHLTSNIIVQQVLNSLVLTHLIFNPDLLKTGKKNIDQLSISGLYKAMVYSNRVGLETNQYLFVLGQRLIRPLTTLVMICLGVPFIFGSLRNVTMGMRVMTGVIVGFAFYILNQFIGPLTTVYHIPPIVTGVLPTLLFAGICLVMLWRIKV